MKIKPKQAKNGYYWIKRDENSEWEIAEWHNNGNPYREGWFCLFGDIDNSIDEKDCFDIDENEIKR